MTLAFNAARAPEFENPVFGEHAGSMIVRKLLSSKAPSQDSYGMLRYINPSSSDARMLHLATFL